MSPPSAPGESNASLNDLAACATVDFSPDASNHDDPVITFSALPASAETASPPQSSIAAGNPAHSEGGSAEGMTGAFAQPISSVTERANVLSSFHRSSVPRLAPATSNWIGRSDG